MAASRVGGATYPSPAPPLACPPSSLPNQHRTPSHPACIPRRTSHPARIFRRPVPLPFPIPRRHLPELCLPPLSSVLVLNTPPRICRCTCESSQGEEARGHGWIDPRSGFCSVQICPFGGQVTMDLSFWRSSNYGSVFWRSSDYRTRKNDHGEGFLFVSSKGLSVLLVTTMKLSSMQFHLFRPRDNPCIPEYLVVNGPAAATKMNTYKFMKLEVCTCG